MIDRYEDPVIKSICSKEAKAVRWEDVELAVINARVKLGLLPISIFEQIELAWKSNPINIELWEQFEKDMDHDLAAFIAERKSYLSDDLARHVHVDMTSYDTEEPAFACMLLDCLDEVLARVMGLDAVLCKLAYQHQFTIMNGRTHGQEAELQSFGKRVLTWLQPIRDARATLEHVRDTRLVYSKISGAIGNYTGIYPELEEKALGILGLKPYVGATQIMPRTFYFPLAAGLNELTAAIGNIAIDIRLGARSGRPIYREWFMKTQVGSSAMPHKKNTIKTENIAGMKILMSGFTSMLDQVMITWEERAIEQSCVERVAWPDLFHVVVHSLKTISKVLEGLQVYPDKMFAEIIETRGCYATAVAKDVLAELLVPQGLSSGDVYRIVQLASFNAHEPSHTMLRVRETQCKSLQDAGEQLEKLSDVQPEPSESIQMIIPQGSLRLSAELAASQEQIDEWNLILIKAFSSTEAQARWDKVFDPEFLLRNENYIYDTILGD